MTAFDDKAAPRRLPVPLMLAASASILAAAHLLRSLRRNNEPRGQGRAGPRSRVAGRAATEEERRLQRAAAAEARLGVGGQEAGGASGRGGARCEGRVNGAGAVAAAASTDGVREARSAGMVQGSPTGVPGGDTAAGAAGRAVDGGVGRQVAQSEAVGLPGWRDPRLTPYGQALLLKREIDQLDEDVKAWRAASARTSHHSATARTSQAPRLVEGSGEAEVESTEVQKNGTAAEQAEVGETLREKLLARVTRATMDLACIEPDISVAPIRREQNARLSRMREVLVEATSPT
ncbi:hypothetical protein CLOM_g22153 [Closterium sp. NIES-68]|nr:hypothetical protein CLOM_g22153 [Closterium sp. NIES-68]GJP74510.1 hypothetical protein CLOP_g5077 [Closterium sp. NIES-67]